MKTLIVLVLCSCCGAVAPAETYLRIDGGRECYADLLTNGLPAVVAEPLVGRMRADGWAPYVAATRPPDTWCTTHVRTLAITNGVWTEGWTEASVPVPLDRAKLVGAILSFPDGTNLLSRALSSEHVAAWFAGNPTYVRGSLGARAVGAALGITADALEAIVQASLSPAP